MASIVGNRNQARNSESITIILQADNAKSPAISQTGAGREFHHPAAERLAISRRRSSRASGLQYMNGEQLTFQGSQAGAWALYSQKGEQTLQHCTPSR